MSELFIRFVIMTAILNSSLLDKFSLRDIRPGWGTVLRNKKFMGDPARWPEHTCQFEHLKFEFELKKKSLELKRQLLNEENKRIQAEKWMKEHEKVKKQLNKSETEKKKLEKLLQELEGNRIVTEKRHEKEVKEVKNQLKKSEADKRSSQEVLMQKLYRMQERLIQKEDEMKNYKKSCDCKEKRIQKLEDILECPICLETASAPIYTCLQFHLICSKCRPQVSKCPECRETYKDQRNFRKHRYAEREAEELNKLKEGS